LELRVAQRALRDGYSAKEVALILVAGSDMVRQIHDRKGKKDAIAFAQHIVRITGQQHTLIARANDPKNLLELGD
jgi:hypothetical protein